MPRPLTGSIHKLANGRWRVSVPAAQGSAKRRTATFDAVDHAERWRTACLEALQTGTQLPPPEACRSTAPVAGNELHRPAAHLRSYADRWYARLYEANQQNGGSRARQVRADLDNHILPFLDAVGITQLAAITPEVVIDFARHLGGWPLTYHLAIEPKARPLRRETGRRVLPTFRRVLQSALSDGLLERDPSTGVRAMVRFGGEDRHADAPPLTLEETARIVGELPPAYQVAAWMMRLLGLRIGEVFGPRVRDVVDDGTDMVLLVHRQGGRTFEERDECGRWVRSTESSRLKTDASDRVMPVPSCLAELIRIIIDAYHTDPDTGGVMAEARLIPGVQQADVGGLGNLRQRLREAAAVTGVRDGDVDERLRPHQLRSALATDIHLRQDAIDAIQQRFLGHRAGDTMLLRHYLLDDPEAQALVDIRDAIEADVRRRLGDLLVPTAASHQWGRDNRHRDEQDYTETVLVACGWRDGGADETWLSTEKVACLLGIHPSKARERMADGRIPAKLRRWGTRECWVARRDDVEAHLAETSAGTSVEELAVRIGQSYHQTYQELRRLRITPAHPGGQRIMLSDEQVECVQLEQQRIRALHERAVRVAEAARLIRRKDRTVRGYLAEGKLELDPETDASGARFVTRRSLEAHLAEREPKPQVESASESMPITGVEGMTGLSRRQLRDLIQGGHLVAVNAGRDVRVTVASLQAWAIGYRPDLLPRLRSVPLAS